jgi:hypothetical protein
MRPTRLTVALMSLVLLAGCAAASPQPARALPTATIALPSPAPSVTLAPVPAATTVGPASCPPTHDDGVSPTYKPDSPVRVVVGRGHVLTGVVLSSRNCAPIPNAKLELWPEQAGKGHPEEQRATIYTNEQGLYRFECNPPEHIHMRISAPGYRTIGVNNYHPEGQSEGELDIALLPQ